jgi:hypothetical protein
MNTLFPFGFSGPTTFYLAVYVLTLVAHVVFMNYVLAGTAVLLVRSLLRRGRGPDAISELLREWLPFGLSAAITAGIAPLLFIQILYKKEFYTANLLLFHRWMLILPALIAGFYLLYALKTSFVGARPRLFALVAAAALGFFLFTALSWTENYLLARSEAAWAPMYASKSVVYRNPEILPRMLLWSVGALPTLAALVGWQLFRKARAGTAVDPADFRAVARLGLFGLVAAGACVAGYGALIGPAARAHATGPMALPWLVVAAVGAAVQGIAWAGLWARGESGRGKWLGLASAGLLLAILGTSCVREVLRITAIDFAALYPEHARAAAVGGRWLFVGFFVINAGLAVWAIRTALAGKRGEAPSEPRGASGS